MPIVFPLRELAPYRPQTYPLLQDADLADLPTLGKIFDDLEDRLSGVKDSQALLEWLDLYDQTVDAVGQETAVRVVERDSDTDNPAYEKAYDHLINGIYPFLEQRWFDLHSQLQKNPAFAQLPAYYDLFRQGVENHLRVYRPENSALAVEDNNLARIYQETAAQWTGKVDGKELLFEEIKSVVENEADRKKRRQAWVAEKQTRVASHDRFHELFLDQVQIRQQMAKNAGFLMPDDPETGDFLRYGYANRGKEYTPQDTMGLQQPREYTPEDTLALHQAVADHIVPLLRRVQEERRQEMIGSGLLLPGEKLRPWDLTVDPQGRPALQPYEEEGGLGPKLVGMMQAIDPRLSAPLVEANRDNLVDAEDRPGKVPCYGNCVYLPIPRRFVLTINGGHSQEGVGTGAHETGHGLYTFFASREQPFSIYRTKFPMESDELSSMSMELLAAKHMDQIYASREDRLRAERRTLEDFLGYMLMVTSTDAFQHWVYAHPHSTREEQDRAWQEQAQRFAGIEDYTGYEEVLRNKWQERPHLIDAPLYSEYLQSGVGALQLWNLYNQDPKKAVDGYIAFLKAGGSVTATQGYALAGIQLDARGETLPDSVAALESRFAQIHREEIDLAAAQTPRRDLSAIVERTVPVTPVPELQKSIV